MPIEQLKKLPSEARLLFERVYKEQIKKGKSEATSSKIAWGVVKSVYHKEGDKWVKNQRKSEKSYLVSKIESSKSVGGDFILEGYILRYEPDDEGYIYTKEFANDILSDLSKGTLYHNNDSIGLLEIQEKKVDDEGLWAKVVINKENPFYTDAVKMITERPDKLSFSVVELTPILDGIQMVEKDGKYYQAHIKGTGLSFGLTDNPINKYAKAKVI